MSFDSTAKKIATGLEWVDKNYDSMDEPTKAVFDEMVQGTTELLMEYGTCKGLLIGSWAAAGIGIAVVAGFDLFINTGIAIIDKVKNRRKTDSSKTETTDSE